MAAMETSREGGGLVLGPLDINGDEEDGDSPVVSSDVTFASTVEDSGDSQMHITVFCLIPGFTECFSPAWKSGPLLL